jgi:prephenate dehydratase
MTTAFLGPPGTFSEEAALLRATTDDLVAFTSFPALVSAVETGLADEAVLPIENSIEGAVSTTLDLLIHETALRISGELAVPVRHFLITAPGLKLAEVRIVTSHPNHSASAGVSLIAACPESSKSPPCQRPALYRT